MNEKKHTDSIGLVDSNILIYIADATEKKKHMEAKRFLEKIKKQPEHFAIALQNLREFCSIMIEKKKMPKEKIGEYIDTFTSSFEMLLKDSEEDVKKASFLSIENNMPFWDCLLATTMTKYNISMIYTENAKDFKSLNQIKTINPLE